ncbi:flavin reductase family protein [soil metagenome]
MSLHPFTPYTGYQVSLSPDDFRDALSRWASGVTLVAARHDGRIVATTVSAFTSLSLDPPLVLVALGPNASVLPFLQPGERFGISILGEQQRRLATSYADVFPVGPDPFPADGEPLVRDALAGLSCTVNEVRSGGDHVLIIAGVQDVRVSGDDEPLIRFFRSYHGLRR